MTKVGLPGRQQVSTSLHRMTTRAGVNLLLRLDYTLAHEPGRGWLLLLEGATYMPASLRIGSRLRAAGIGHALPEAATDDQVTVFAARVDESDQSHFVIPITINGKVQTVRGRIYDPAPRTPGELGGCGNESGYWVSFNFNRRTN